MMIAVKKVGDKDMSSKTTVWHPSWKVRDEASVQKSMVNIATLLNALPNQQLTWDFDISNTETLDTFKPDGHGRLFKDSAHRKNVMSQAVVVELKASALTRRPILALDSRGKLWSFPRVWSELSLIRLNGFPVGQLLQYCIEILNFDKTRSFVYGILTDLSQFRLFKVTRPAVEFNLAAGVKATRHVSWYKAGDAYCGLQIMARLSRLSPVELGMRPLASGLHRFHITGYLGSGHEASVYRVENPGATRPATLKVARSPNGSGMHKFENERAVLIALHDPSTPAPETAPVDVATVDAATVDAATVDAATVDAATVDAADVPASAAQSALADEAAGSKRELVPLDHIPAVATSRHPAFVLMMFPLALKLTCINIRAIFVYQLFQLLQWLHVDIKRFHGDLSYNNLMLAPAGWRLGTKVDGTRSLLLIDWEFSAAHSEVNAANVLQGTPLTMSQQQLGAVLEHLEMLLAFETSGRSDTAPASSFTYGVEDELEAAVKSILLIISPSLKRRLKQEAVTSADHISSKLEPLQTGRPMTPPIAKLTRQRNMFQHVRNVWDRVLPSKVSVLCQRHEYIELADWLCMELLHFDPKEK